MAILLILLGFVTFINCNDVVRETKIYIGREVYDDSNTPPNLIYTLPGKNIKFITYRNSNSSLLWYRKSFGRIMDDFGRVGKLYSVYRSYIPDSEQLSDIYYDITINDVSQKRHDRTYVYVDTKTMEIQETFILNIFDSPFLNDDIIYTHIDPNYTQLNNDTVLNCGINITEQGWEYFRWMHFPIQNDTDIYEHISVNEYVIPNKRSEYELNNYCNLRVIRNKPGLYVFRAKFNNDWFVNYHVKTYILM